MKNIKVVTEDYSSASWNGFYFYTYSGCNNNITLKDAIESYIKNIRLSHAQNTIYCYSRDLLHLLERIGNIKMSSLDEEVFNNFSSQIFGGGIKKSCRSVITLNRIKSTYRSFFIWCYKKKLLM